MTMNEHEKARKRLFEQSECLTSDEVMQRLEAMGVIRRVHRDRRRMPLEEILFSLVAVGVAVMVGWGVYLFR